MNLNREMMRMEREYTAVYDSESNEDAQKPVMQKSVAIRKRKHKTKQINNPVVSIWFYGDGEMGLSN